MLDMEAIKDALEGASFPVSISIKDWTFDMKLKTVLLSAILPRFWTVLLVALLFRFGCHGSVDFQRFELQSDEERDDAL